MKKHLFIILLIFSLTANSGCMLVSEGFQYFSADRDRSADVLTDNGHMLIHVLVQRIVDSIRSDNDIETLFQSIPSRQRQNISLDQYQQYIKLLRRGIAGDISSFSIMSLDELETMRSDMILQRPDQEDLINNMRGVWLYFREIGRFEEKFAIFLKQAEDNPPELSSEWISQILYLSEVSTLYFDAIDHSDADALAVLLQHEQPDKKKDILNVKASRIIDFYQHNIGTRSSEFRVLQARIDRLQYEAFGAASQVRQTAVSRVIEFRSLSDLRYEINDTIPDTIQQLDLNVLFSEQHLFKLASVDSERQPEIIRSNVFESIVGEPDEHDDSNCTTIGNVQRLTLEYESMDITVEGTCFRHSRWEGSVRSVLIHDNRTRLGSGLRPGQTANDILRRYPFADETDYVITGQFEGGPVQLNFIVDEDDIIEAIELTLADR